MLFIKKTKHLVIYSLIIVLYQVSNAFAETQNSIPTIEQSALTMNINGISMHVEKYGKGEPIVMVHGGPGFDHNHLNQFKVLAKDYQVIFYDQRGSGDSDSEINATSITMKNFVEDLEALRQSLKIEKINLLGASFGGLVGLNYAIHYPQNVKSLVLVGSVPASLKDFDSVGDVINKNTSPEDEKALRKIELSEGFKNNEEKSYEEYYRMFFKSYLYNPLLAKEIDLNFGKNTIKNMNLINELMYSDLGDFDIYNKLSVINSPTLILHGDRDPFPYSSAEKIHEKISLSEYYLYKKTGHFIYLEEPVDFFKKLNDFYKGIK